MKREGRRTISILVGLCLVSLLTPDVAPANDLERHLEDLYKGKIVVLRGFYSGQTLRYDSSGLLVGQKDMGDWTTDGFIQVDQIRSSRQSLSIKARRLTIVSKGKQGFHFIEKVPLGHKNSKAARLEIEAAFGDSVTAETVTALLSRIFLGPQDDFVELVPDYWRECLLEGISGKNESCRFPPEIARIPGMKAPSQGASWVADSSASSPQVQTAMKTNSSERFKLGGSVKPPKPLYQPEPSFTREARKARYQGIVTMGLIVDQQGLPKDIHILSPLGAGLDARAVQAVETWKFQPAQKDGQPVPVKIAIEVDFHLY